MRSTLQGKWISRLPIRRWRWWRSIRIPGKLLAMVGGRSYGLSQLNHALAKRPTGSIFKPFVYATAFNTDLYGKPSAGT